MIDKKVLRARLRAARDRFVLEYAPEITVPAGFVARLTPELTVGAYVALGGEADPKPLVEAALAAGCALALAHVTGRDAPMRFLKWRPGDPLETGWFDLIQPAASSAEARPDIILTPLVGFDAGLNRLGQGAGFYDRAFAANPQAWRVGVAWSVQQVDAVPVDPWDVPLHALITEQDWLTR